MICTRKQNEEMEAAKLASYAVKSAESAGRVYPEEEDAARMCFQKDKERVIHSKAFRRLDQKTQVFTAGSGDHYRTRLTHTLEVAQIARDIARRLAVNEDLCEVIALAHDLGHPPFGHSGESALSEVMKNFGLSFEHNEQSKRIVEKLEKNYPAFDGLNLSIEVLDGLIKHQTAFDQAGRRFEKAAHLEAQVVNVADEIAYTAHDLDDGLRSGFIRLEGVRGLDLWKKAEAAMREKYGELEDEQIMVARVVSRMISLLIDDFCYQTDRNLQEAGVRSLADVVNFQGSLGSFSVGMRERIDELRHYLYENFYLHPDVLAKNREGVKMIKSLFQHYLPEMQEDPVVVKDYIAGMTDSFLRREYEKAIIVRN